jgi:hypothetical protein
MAHDELWLASGDMQAAGHRRPMGSTVEVGRSMQAAAEKGALTL